MKLDKRISGRIHKRIFRELFFKIFNFLNNKNFRVNCLIVGTQRAGTSSIIEMLSRHKQIVTPKDNMELFFFSQYYNPENNYKNYHTNFTNNYFKKIFFKKKIFVEKTPDYFLKKKYLLRIYKYNPKIKIILILRNPYERILSSYFMFRKIREIEKSKNIREFKEIQSFYKSVKKYLKKNPINYLDYSLYYEKINNVFKIFPKTNVLLINFKHLYRNSSKRKIFRFLDRNLDTKNIYYKKINASVKITIPKKEISKTYKFIKKFVTKDLSKIKKKYHINL